MRLASGETATLPLAQTLARRPANGKVVLGVRPEHLFRYDPNLKAQKAGLAMLTAPVEVVEPTGAETHAVLKLGEQEIVGRFDPDGAPRLGERWPLGIDMGHACLFDPETQALIPQSRRLTFAIYPSLAGRTVFISGGATGIGADIVRAFARNHARVAFVDVQRAEGEALAAAVKGEGGTALFLRCDVTDIAALQAAIAEAAREARPDRGPGQQRRQRRAPCGRRRHRRVLGPRPERESAASFFAAQAVHPQMRELGLRLDHQSLLDRLARRGRDAGLCRGQGRRSSA